jgi:D-alanyl-D-alanine carboxypeptidase
MRQPRFLSARIDGAGKVLAATPQYPVPWWSFTKTVLAAAALKLVGEGRLSLDRPLSDRSFSLRHLLQHRSGLPDYGGIPAYQAAARNGEAPMRIELLLQRANAAQSLFEPGQGWHYSNIGYFLVRQLIEAHTGMDLIDALNSLVLNRLGEHSVRLADSRENLQRTAWGNTENYHPGWVYHGLLTGTPVDAARFLYLLINGKILATELYVEMLSRHPVNGVQPGRPWDITGYGLGLMLGHAQRVGQAIGHSGAGPGSSAAVYHFPDHIPQTVAVFTQVEDQGPAEFEAARLADPTANLPQSLP